MSYYDVVATLDPLLSLHCDDTAASATLVDLIAGNNLTPNGEAEHLYQQTSILPSGLGYAVKTGASAASSWLKTSPTGITPSLIFGVDAWIRTTAFFAVTESFILARCMSPDTTWCVLSIVRVDNDTAKLAAYWNRGSGNVSAQSVNAVLTRNTQHHVAASFNQTTIVLEVDGVVVPATQGTTKPNSVAVNRFTIGMGGFGGNPLRSCFYGAVNLYGRSLTAQDFASLAAEAPAVADTNAGVYNAAAIRPIWAAMGLRRVDIAGGGDSNFIYDPANLEENTGHFNANMASFDSLVPLYGLGVGPFEAAGFISGPNQNFQYRSTLYSSDALPSWLEDITLTTPANLNELPRKTHVFIADGNSTSLSRDNLAFYAPDYYDSIFNRNLPLRYHLTVAGDGVSAGNFRFGHRTGLTNQSDTGGTSELQSTGDTEELVDLFYDIPLADRGSGTFYVDAMAIDSPAPAEGNRINGPFYCAYQQVEFTSRKVGARYHAMSPGGGLNVHQLAVALKACSVESVAELFRQYVRLQSGAKKLIIHLNHGINDIVDANDSLSWNQASDDFTSVWPANTPDGFANDHAAIMDVAVNAWSWLEANTSLGCDPEDLAFIFGACHPKQDSPSVNGVTKTHVAWLDIFYDSLRHRAWPNATIIKGNELVTTAAMAAAYEYRQNTHRIVCSSYEGEFVPGQNIEQANSGATGTFEELAGYGGKPAVYIKTTSGTFTNNASDILVANSAEAIPDGTTAVGAVTASSAHLNIRGYQAHAQRVLNALVSELGVPPFRQDYNGNLAWGILPIP